MKTKIYNYLNKPYVVVLIMLIAPIFGFIDRNFVFFFGLFIALFLLWQDGWNWARFGFGKKISISTALKGLLIAIVTFIIIDIGIQPFIEIYFGEIDLSSINEIRGDFVSFFILFIVMWVFAAFGEEFLFSGYYMKHLAEFMGNTDKTWFFSAIILSIYFGFSHSYQGISGMIAVGLASVVFFFLFYKNKSNLAILVFAHGFYDTIGLTLIYLEKDRIFYELALNLI